MHRLLVLFVVRRGRYTQCFERDGAPEPFCPSIPCCSAHTDQASCDADPSCVSDGCPSSCGSGSSIDFLDCYQKGASPAPHACPPIACEPSCESHPDQTSCDADSTCASVFSGQAPCGIGCEVHFEHCGSNAPTCIYDGSHDCAFAPIVCASGYTAIAEGNGSCVTGCVRSSVCEPGDGGTS